MHAPRLTLASCLILLLAMTEISAAQPGRSNYPAPGPRGPIATPYGQPAPHLLTPEERQLLADGEITAGQTIGGGLISIWLGFGLGHAVQGRYSSTGWKFTLGQVAAIGGIFVGLGTLIQDDLNRRDNSTGENIILISAVSYGILRVWDAIDAFTGPSAHNRRVRDARWKAYGYQARPRYSLFVAPTQQGGGVAGLTLQF